jgi:type I restriction enzyme, S subunit
MSKNNLIPDLRFPEFKNEGDWENKPLDDLCKLVRGPFGGALKKEIFVQKGYAVYEQSHAIYSDFNSFRYRIVEEKYSELKRFSVRASDLIMSCSGTMGKFAIIPKNYEQGIINQALLKLTIKKDFDIWFVKISLETEHNQNKLLSQSAGGAIKNVVSVSQIKELELAVPKLPEQKKIASCLSSLDELIATHSQKLDLLKDHKKGLMQNLFPQEGEKVPKYRFMEFEKDGEWKEDILFNLALDGFSNGVFNDPKKVGSGYKLINVINMYSESPISENNLTLLELNDSEFEKNKVKYGDIFFTRSSLVPEGIAKSNIYLGSSDDITYDGHLIRMRPNKELIYPVYLHYLLKTENVRSQMIAKGKTATMTTIGQSDVASVKTSYSKNPKEQQKIASCLSSLDALITAQAEKIEQLKLHKKGLMQGLFPKIND